MTGYWNGCPLPRKPALCSMCESAANWGTNLEAVRGQGRKSKHHKSHIWADFPSIASLTATINITWLYTSSPLNCCTNMDKSRAVLHSMPIYGLFPTEVYFPLSRQEHNSVEIRLGSSLVKTDPHFQNSFLDCFWTPESENKAKLSDDLF